MTDHLRNPLFLHPALHSTLDEMLKTIQHALPQGWTTGTSSAGIHRTPNEQFDIFKKGRTFKNGAWVKTGEVVTYKDGFVNKSRHNYLPSTAVDIVLFRPEGTELSSGPKEDKHRPLVNHSQYSDHRSFNSAANQFIII